MSAIHLYPTGLFHLKWDSDMIGPMINNSKNNERIIAQRN